MKLSLINDLEDQMPVAELAGHVTAVFPRKEGEGEYGPWSFQDATLSDGETEVRLKFKNMEDMKPIQGKDVAIRANKSKAHGLTGVLKVVEEYKGKTFHKVQLTNSCKIVVGLPNGKDEPDDVTRVYKASELRAAMQELDEGHLESASPKMLGKQGSPPSTEDFIPMTHGSKGEALPGVDEAKAHIMQAVNLYNLCVDAVDTCVKPHIENCSAELYQAAVSTLFIESSSRRTLNGVDWWSYVDKMPAKPFQKSLGIPVASSPSKLDSVPF